MSKELKNITENVMNQIHQGKAKMKPKIYFIIGSIFTFVGLISSIIISIFFVGLTRFSFRTYKPMDQYRFDQIISNFPWWTIVFAISSLIIGILLIQKYDFSYKKNSLLIISGFILAIIITGYIVDFIGFNEALFQYRPMSGMMNNYFPRNNFQSIPQKGMMRNNFQGGQW